MKKRISYVIFLVSLLTLTVFSCFSCADFVLLSQPHKTVRVSRQTGKRTIR